MNRLRGNKGRISEVRQQLTTSTDSLPFLFSLTSPSYNNNVQSPTPQREPPPPPLITCVSSSSSSTSPYTTNSDLDTPPISPPFVFNSTLQNMTIDDSSNKPTVDGTIVSVKRFRGIQSRDDGDDSTETTHALCVKIKNLLAEAVPLHNTTTYNEAESVSRSLFYNVVHNFSSAASDAMHINYLQPQANGRYVGLMSLKDWMLGNVLAPLFSTAAPVRRMLQISPPVRTGVFFSETGSGVCSYVTAMCREMRLNLMVIRSDSMPNSPDRLPELLNEARSMQPCVVLFDRCYAWFRPGQYMHSGASKYFTLMRNIGEQHNVRETSHSEVAQIGYTSSYINPENVWTIVSLTSPADTFPVDDAFMQLHDCRKSDIPNALDKELESFVGMYIRDLLMRSGIKEQLQIEQSIGDFRERVEDWVDVIHGQTPGFVTLVVSRCLEVKRKSMFQRLATEHALSKCNGQDSTATYANAEYELQKIVPTGDEVRTQMAQLLRLSKPELTDVSKLHPNKQGSATMNVTRIMQNLPQRKY